MIRMRTRADVNSRLWRTVHTYAAHCCAPLVKHEKRFYQCERPITHCKPLTLQDGRYRHLADLHAHQDPCSNESLFFPFSGYTKILCKRLLTAWNLITQILILLTRCFAAFRSLCSITVSSRGFSTNSFELRTSYNWNFHAFKLTYHPKTP